MTVENSEIRMLAAPMPDLDTAHIRIYQSLSSRRRKLISDGVVYPSQTETKWWDFDITSATKSWLAGQRNLGLELECLECREEFQPVEVSINTLVYFRPARIKRASFHHQREKRGRTDCRSTDRKKRCCRHTLRVYFKDLNLVEMNSIIQPKYYEAGFCRGRCPMTYNHGSNHSRIQNIVHKMNKTIPRVCCAATKLAGVEILRVDPYDHNKLNMDTWDNMKVLECSCS